MILFLPLNKKGEILKWTAQSKWTEAVIFKLQKGHREALYGLFYVYISFLKPYSYLVIIFLSIWAPNHCDQN